MNPLERNATGALFSPKSFSILLMIRSAPPLRSRLVPMIEAMAIKMPMLDAVFPNAVPILLPSGCSANAVLSKADMPLESPY